MNGRRAILLCLTLLLARPALAADARASAPVRGWLSWRGPEQHGVSREQHPPERFEPGGAGECWSHALPGRGTPVVADGRLHVVGYRGHGSDLVEVLATFDARTGQLLWEHAEADFLSDVAYERYAIGSPAVDPDTGQVYAMTAAGLLSAFTRDGRLLWQRSMMEESGRLTFPNGRNGAPVIDGRLVIVHAVTAGWGAHGPARDRFHAFDKHTGAQVWVSSPGDTPRDNSFSTPLLSWQDGRRVFYAGGGDGSIVAVDARTGEPLWRFPMATGGINASLVLHGRHLIAVHDADNLDMGTTGRMVAVDPGRREGARTPPPGESGPLVLGPAAEVWRTDVASFSSSPVLDGDRLYQVDRTGTLHAIDARTGHTAWKLKLGTDQLHASPLLAGGLLYVPMTDGTLHVLRPRPDGADVLHVARLEGSCLGAPIAWNGRIYVHTTERLYCFGGEPATASVPPAPAPEPAPAGAPGAVARLQVRPSELLLRPGERVPLRVLRLDARGLETAPEPPGAQRLTWRRLGPASQALNAQVDAEGVLVAGAGVSPSAGVLEVSDGQRTAPLRVRVLPAPPFSEDFESFIPSEPHPTETGTRFTWPPLAWPGARNAWEVREAGGGRVLAKTLDKPMLQRSTTFIGAPDLRAQDVLADVMSDGNRRMMSDVGVVNQRYLIALRGNAQQLQVSSNHERLNATAPFAWSPGTWYRLRTRVDARPDGSGVVRARAWKRGTPEPSGWTLEVPLRRVHDHGAPGLFGFSPRNRFRVYLDNVAVIPSPSPGGPP